MIAVGWSQGAAVFAGLPYFQSAANTRVVGAMVARLLQDLHELGTDYKVFDCWKSGTESF